MTKLKLYKDILSQDHTCTRQEVFNIPSNFIITAVEQIKWVVRDN